MRIRKSIKLVILAAALAFTGRTGVVRAEEYDEYYDEYYDDYSDEGEDYEEEYIPETYYDPIQSNDIKNWPQGQAIQAAAGIVMDMDTDAVLYAKNVTDKHYPASITKIMTTLVAIENAQDLDAVITCGEEVYDIEEDSSNLGIQPGEEITLRQALYGLMLESANDLGNAIAVYIAGSVENFAALMNQKAEQLGCVNTHFTNPHGLHSENHYVCAIDMAKIAQAAYMNDTFREIVTTRESMIPKTNIVEEERYFANHQKLMQPESDYYQEWCTGGKTGYTTDAWNTLVTYAEKNGMRLVCVVLRENGADNQYRETTDLINYGFDHFRKEYVSGDIETQTFYDILDLRMPDRGTTLEDIPSLHEQAVAISEPGLVTLPDTIQASDLTVRTAENPKGNLIYLYEDNVLGYGSIAFNPLPVVGKFAYQQPRDMERILKLGDHVRKVRELRRTSEDAFNLITGFSGRVYSKAEDYVDNNRMTVLLAGGFILLILVIILVIVILRVTRESRIQKRREQEEKQRLAQAEKIDAQSASEIEQELRQAMEEERLRKEEQERRRAQQEEEERKLRETEELLEQIRREHAQ